MSDYLDSKYEFDLLLTHEIGHAIGFSHTEKSCNDHIMNPYIGRMNYKFISIE